MANRNSTRVQAPDNNFPVTRSSSTHQGAVMRGGTQSLTEDGAVRMSTNRAAGSSPDLRHRLRLATWNVTTLSGVGYQEALVRELSRHHIGIAGISESRLPGSGCQVVEGALLLHSGGDQLVNGVALIVRSPFSKALLSWHPISDRLLKATFSHKHGHMTIIVAYAPTETASDSAKEDFYIQLSTAVQSVPPHDILVVLGDLNAVTGTDSANQPSVGPFPSGISNDNSDHFLAFCGLNGLSVLGSWFQHLNIHRWTWITSNTIRTQTSASQ